MSVQKSIVTASQNTAPYSILHQVVLKLRKVIVSLWVDAVSLVVIVIIFVVPFVFILLTAAKTRQEAGLFQFSWPSQFQLIENIQEVMAFNENRMFLALWNSLLLTVGS